jgi:uncharacterized protein YegJ (DUF2314 family)
MSESKVFMFDNSDPEMQQAYAKARATFRYFWRELAWEHRRIVPALDMHAVKAPFSDGDEESEDDEHPSVEQMWLGEVNFDGQFVTGVLLNSPNWLKSIGQGDSAKLAISEITDWMYVVSGEVYGAFTVNLMRSRMSRKECKEHDAAWGLNFGDPSKPRIVPFKTQDLENDEHPMSLSMASSLRDQLKKNPDMANEPDDRNWTFLHHQCLAGSAATVKVLLEFGADPSAVTDDGLTPRDLALSLGWTEVAALVSKKR